MHGGDPQKGGPRSRRRVSLCSTMHRKIRSAAQCAGGGRRLALAKWLVADDNPLTPRVLANRVWHYHFGTGIVDTPSDFGYMGGRPTHPELLDYLATRLKANGWRLKPLHREIMLSAAYRQASSWQEGTLMRSITTPDCSGVFRRGGSRPKSCATPCFRSRVCSTSRKTSGPGFRLYRYLNDNVSTYLPLDQHESGDLSAGGLSSKRTRRDGGSDERFRRAGLCLHHAATLRHHDPAPGAHAVQPPFTIDMATLSPRDSSANTLPTRSPRFARAFALATGQPPLPPKESAASTVDRRARPPDLLPRAAEFQRPAPCP